MLDPPSSLETNERSADAILCVAEIEAEAKARFSAVRSKQQSCGCYTGLTLAALATLATLARMHLVEPRTSTRATIMGMSGTAINSGQRPCIASRPVNHGGSKRRN